MTVGAMLTRQTPTPARNAALTMTATGLVQLPPAMAQATGQSTTPAHQAEAPAPASSPQAKALHRQR
jgi:hypothetical protein